jgi:serine/threonine protein kinase
MRKQQVKHQCGGDDKNNNGGGGIWTVQVKDDKEEEMVHREVLLAQKREEGKRRRLAQEEANLVASTPDDLRCPVVVILGHIDTEKIKLFDKIRKGALDFPEYLSADARDILTGLLQRDPAARLGSSPAGFADIKAHAFFRGTDWEALDRKAVPPPFVPRGEGAGGAGDETDIANFDTTFTSEPVVMTPPVDSTRKRSPERSRM